MLANFGTGSMKYKPSFGILLNAKTFQLSMPTQRKQYCFVTCKRHYNNDVSCFKDSTFASIAQWRRPYFFQNG